jgi:hypothetical protein
MEVPNQDLKTISKISVAQKVDEINEAGQRTIYAVPGVSPLAPPKLHGRSKYNEVQLDEAVALAAIVGVAAAARRTGVRDSTIYKYAASKGKTITYLRRGDKAKPVPRRKYADSVLRAAFQRGLTWHQNTGVSIRLCIERAADEAKINKNYLWALYCSKDQVLGFGGAS